MWLTIRYQLNGTKDNAQADGTGKQQEVKLY